MNKLTGVIVIAMLLGIAACKKDSTTSCTPSDTTQTYTAKVKAIMDANCISSGCHDAATASGGVNLTTFAGTVSATKNNNLVQQVQTGLMPQGASKLADADIASIIAWRDNCYQE